MTTVLSLDDRALGWRLGLGDLESPPVCHGYANICVCKDCRERSRNQLKPKEVRQPWDVGAEAS